MFIIRATGFVVEISAFLSNLSYFSSNCMFSLPCSALDFQFNAQAIIVNDFEIQ